MIFQKKKRNFTLIPLGCFVLVIHFSLWGQSKTLPETCQFTRQLSQQSHFGEPKARWADFILVDKSRRLLHLFQDDQIIKTYRMALGFAPKGAKRESGDGKTPEGSYFIDSRNSGSDFHLALHISYPNQEDREEARKRGVSPGGAIMVHGLPNEKWKHPFLGHPSRDWTKGCVAVTDKEIEDIWDLVKTGTPIDLCP